MSEANNVTEKEKEMENIKANSPDEMEDENDTTLLLSKPVTFEQKEYKKIDLSGLQDINTGHLKRARRMMNVNGTSLEIVPERSIEFACNVASIVTGIPVGFFDLIPARDGITLKNMVIGFLY